MNNVVSSYYKFFRTHHARGVCYHFGTGIQSVSKMQCTTQRVHSKRDLIKTLTYTNIARNHHNRIIYRFVQGWSRQIMGGRLLLFAILLLCEITANMHIKHVDCLYNSINRYMIRLWWSRAMFVEVRVLNRSRLLQTLWVEAYTAKIITSWFFKKWKMSVKLV